MFRYKVPQYTSFEKIKLFAIDQLSDKNMI